MGLGAHDARMPTAATLAGLAVLVALASVFGIKLTEASGRVAAIWLANAFVLTAVLRAPRGAWPRWLGAGLVGNVVADMLVGDSSITALALSLCNTLEVVVAAGMMEAAVGSRRLDLARPRTLVVFIVAAGLLAPAVSGLVAAAILHHVAAAPFWITCRRWFLADTLGLLVVVPILATTRIRNVAGIIRSGRRAEAAALGALLPVAAVVIFRLDAIEWLFLLVPLVLLPVFRLGFEGAAVAVFTSAAGGIAGILWHASQDATFHRMHLVSLQMFLITEVLTALPIATLVQASRASEAKARESAAGLEQETARYEELARTLPVGIYRYRMPVGAPQYFEYVSPTFCALVGADEAEILRDAKVVFDAAHPDDREGLIRANQVAESTLAPFRWEGRFVVGGVVRWVQIASDPTPEPGGGSRWSGVVTDITAQRLAEEAKQRAQELTTRILEITPEVIYIYDLGEQRNVYSNSEITRILGMSPEDVASLGDHLFAEVMHPDDFEPVAAHHRRFAALADDRVLEVEYRMRHARGHWVTLRSRDRAFARDDQGRVTQIIGVAADITEQRKAEDALLESRERFRAMFEEAPLGVALIESLTGRILEVNRRFAAIVGRTPEEVTSTDWMAITHPDDVQADLDNTALLNAGRIPGFEMQKRYVKPDGTPVWIHLTVARVLAGEPGVPRHLAMVEDITERRAAEQRLREVLADLERRVAEEVTRAMAGERALIQQSRLAAMGEMIGHIAHQWRQPLNALGMVMANLREARRRGELTDASIDEAVGHGFGLIRQMSSTISDFTEFFRPDKAVVAFAVRGQVEQALSLVGASFRHHGIAVTVTGGDGVVTQGFPGEYSQVLLNLLSNARDALLRRDAAERSVEIRIDASGPHCCVTIADSGGGIPIDPPERVFEPYFTTKAGGIGLGLYMSKTILEQSMRGTISVANGPRGAEFTIRTPLVEKETHAGR